jgi:hypothetical protein
MAIDYIAIATDHVANLYPEGLFYFKPPMRLLPRGTIIGNWAYSVPGKLRYILDREAEIAPGVMPGDLARAWIRDQYLLPLRRRTEQLFHYYSVPLHARRGKHGDCYYVDISGAYRHILGLGFNVEYEFGRYIGAEPRPLPSQIAQHKTVYSVAVAMSSNGISDFLVVGREGLFHRRPYNLFSNPCLYALAGDTLNAMGSEMLAVLGENCVYVNTDGYIVKEGYEQYAIDIIHSWGFEAKIKEQGETIVRGTASWRVGEAQTKRFNRQAEDYTSILMPKEDRLWLKKRWIKWSNVINGQSIE